jgi:hypothetical protein
MYKVYDLSSNDWRPAVSDTHTSVSASPVAMIDCLPQNELLFFFWHGRLQFVLNVLQTIQSIFLRCSFKQNMWTMLNLKSSSKAMLSQRCCRGRCTATNLREPLLSPTRVRKRWRQRSLLACCVLACLLFAVLISAHLRTMTTSSHTGDTILFILIDFLGLSWISEHLFVTFHRRANACILILTRCSFATVRLATRRIFDITV